MGAVSHLVSAAHDAFETGTPGEPSSSPAKSIRHFEQNSDNATTVFLVKSVVLNPQQLYQMFPRVRISTQSAA